jgi:WhiB family redox-sensing transcriptional regulator
MVAGSGFDRCRSGGTGRTVTVPELAVRESPRRRSTSQPSWYDAANCRGQSRLFYPPPGEAAAARLLRERRAAGVCGRCVVRDDCRSWAREQHEFGFWGGESEAARSAAGFVPRTVGELRVTPERPTQVRDRRIRTTVP